MAGFKQKSIKEIQANIISSFRAKVHSVTSLLFKSVIKSLSYGVAGVASLMWNQLNWLYLQLFIESCCLVVLKLWGALVGVFFKEGTTATLQIRLINVSADIIRSGTVWKHLTSGVVYKSISSVSPTGGVAELSVTAQIAGPVGNLAVGEILQIANPLEGVPETAEVLAVVVEGSNAEETEDYRKRVKLRYQRKPQGGSFVDYCQWAMECPGIVDVLPYLLNTGTITLFLVGEGSGLDRTPSGFVKPNPFPEWENGQMKLLSGSGQFYEVAKLINGVDDLKNTRRPAGAVVELKTANYIPFRVVIDGLTVNTDAIVKLIRSNIVSCLDTKRPNIPAIGYSEQDARVNAQEISAIVQNVIKSNGGSFNSFQLKNGEDVEITETILGIGSLAYLEKLKVNGSDISL